MNKMVSDDLVSVIIPVYKTEQYLEKCLLSVLQQEYTKIEVIVVDDGSPDNAYIVAEKYEKSDKRVRLIRQQNKGLSGARNTGIREAKGKYLIFLDSDDTLVSNAVTNMVLQAKKTQANMVIPQYYYQIDEETQTMRLRKHFTDEMRQEVPIKFGRDVLIGKGRAWKATALLYSADIIKQNNIEFPEGYTSEDIVFNLKVLAGSEKITFYQKPTQYYVKRTGTITTTFWPEFYRTIQFIDGIVLEFLKKTEQNDNVGIKKRNALLCRNLVVYMISAMNADNGWTWKEKRQFVKELLTENQEAFKEKLENPYFDKRIKIVFIQFEYWLIRHRMYFAAELIAVVSGRFMRKV